MSKKVESAFTNYENEVIPSKSGGFSSMVGDISGMISSVTSAATDKLNSLIAIGSTFDLSSLVVGKLSSLASKYLSGLTSMLGFMSSDAKTALANSATVFSMNIAENFINDVKKTIYIPEQVFLIQVKALYYAGGDLAYQNQYIRKSALSRDWVETLKFCDQEYGVVYTRLYSGIEVDLRLAARNGCWKNVSYILSNVVIAHSSAIASFEKLTYSGITSGFTYDSLKSEISYYEELFPKYISMMISFSYSYLTCANVKSVLEKFSDFVTPKMFGSTDDKYKSKYAFTYSDVLRMMPSFIPTDNTSEINRLLENTDVEDSKTAKELLLEGNAISDKDIASNAYQVSSNVLSAVSKIGEFRSNVLNNKTSLKSSITEDSIPVGSSDDYIPLATNNDQLSTSWDTVYYREKFDLSPDDYSNYITLRNKNIKIIYVMLSNKTIWGSNVMINEEYYNRCVLKTMTTVTSALSQVKDLLGVSGPIQTVYEVADIINSSIYTYQKFVEGSLLDPTNNETIDTDNFKEILMSEYSLDGNYTDFILPDGTTPVNSIESGLQQAATVVNGVENGGEATSTGSMTNSSTSSNTAVSEEIAATISSDFTTKSEINAIIRYLTKLTMITKRDVIIKYLTWFYNTGAAQEIEISNLNEIFTYLIYTIFGRTNINTPAKINDLFNNASDSTLNDNISIMISIYKMNLIVNYLHLYNYDKRTSDTMNNIYKLAMLTMSYEIESLSFSKAVYLYDTENLRSIVKQMFLSKIDYLKSIVKVGDSQFFREKDTLTTVFSGFDRQGILGFDEQTDNRIKYTNIEVGDWNEAVQFGDKTFFAGNSLTSGNGIKYTTRTSDTIMSTLTTTGNWSIEIHCGYLFFINKSNDSLYVWNDSTNNVVVTNITDISNWEFKDLEKYSTVMLVSKIDKGIKIWNDNTKIAEFTICTSGSDYDIKLISRGYVFYTKNSKNKVFIYNGKTLSYIYSNGIRVTSMCTFSEEINVNWLELGVVDPLQPEVVPLPVKKEKNIVRYHLIIGTINNGMLDLYDDDGSNNFIVNDKLSIKCEDVYIFDVGNGNVKYIMREIGNEKYNKFGLLSLRTKKEYSFLTALFFTYTDEVTGKTENVFSSGKIISGFSESVLLKNETISNCEYINLTDNCLLFYQDYTYYNTGCATVEEHKTNRWSYIDNINKIENEIFSIEFQGIDIIKVDQMFPNGILKLFISTKNDIYIISNSIFKSIITDDIYKISGWDYYYFNNYLIFINEKGLGINYYDNSTNSLVKSNLITGHWNLIKGSKYYYAVSKDGTNGGIKKSNNNFSFLHLPNVQISSGDYGKGTFDEINKRMYIGALRNKTLVDVSAIALLFDINEFVYYQNVYQLSKISNLMNKSSTNDILDALTDILGSGESTDISNYVKPTVISSESNNYLEKMINGATESSSDAGSIKTIINNDDGTTTTLITNEDGSTESQTINDDGTTTVVKVDTNGISTTTINATIIDESDLLLISGKSLTELTGEMTTSLRKIEKNSDFYADVDSSAMAYNEFDITDSDQINNVIWDILINNPINPAGENLIRKFEAELRKSYIEHDPDPESDKLSTVELVKHEYTSDEFLDNYVL